jgi:hypothetical protein
MSSSDTGGTAILGHGPNQLHPTSHLTPFDLAYGELRRRKHGYVRSTEHILYLRTTCYYGTVTTFDVEGFAYADDLGGEGNLLPLL